MKNKVTIFLIIFLAGLFIVCVIRFGIKRNIIENERKSNESETEQTQMDIFIGITKEDLLNETKWVDITENDKITFAYGASVPIIEEVTTSLRKEETVICYVVGGRFDDGAKGSYIALTGFDKEGKVRILSQKSNYVEESYVFERIFENVNKILILNYGGANNE